MIKITFVGGKSVETTIISETKQYMVIRCKGNTMKYRYNKVTQEVQDGTYHKVLKGLSLTITE
jgi:hypothetical protein